MQGPWPFTRPAKVGDRLRPARPQPWPTSMRGRGRRRRPAGESTNRRPRPPLTRNYRDVERSDRTVLTTLVTRTHRVQPSYVPAVQLYSWVDLQPDLSLPSLYNGDRYTPADFIERDIDVARQRREESRRITRDGSRNEQIVEDLFESMLPDNCEPSVPQSWFGKKAPMLRFRF